MSQKPIGFGLITATVGFKPCDNVGIQTHRHRLLRWPIELADFGAAPIKDSRRIRKINVFVSFCGDESHVSLLLFVSFLIGSPFVGLGSASRDDTNDFFVVLLIKKYERPIEWNPALWLQPLSSDPRRQRWNGSFKPNIMLAKV